MWLKKYQPKDCFGINFLGLMLGVDAVEICILNFVVVIDWEIVK
jgi:hypothetical protein